MDTKLENSLEHHQHLLGVGDDEVVVVTNVEDDSTDENKTSENDESTDENESIEEDKWEDDRDDDLYVAC
ncbi:hypothetical protein RND71_038478 [Anisodus tanguticus]|uniref:Uncharacterized protein n=1 Tax=Anisodus tanguticus TaxID=243964 RepID=A0AAE1R2Q7_9SOLA|nr:hypothetical protein RND71_038478 [Anisodus tanguticus]